jgi:hypothetical protein
MMWLLEYNFFDDEPVSSAIFFVPQAVAAEILY